MGFNSWLHTILLHVCSAFTLAIQSHPSYSYFKNQIKELQMKFYCPPDCLLVRRYGRFPSRSSGKPFLDFSGVYISSSGGSKGANTAKKNLHSVNIRKGGCNLLTQPVSPNLKNPHLNNQKIATQVRLEVWMETLIKAKIIGRNCGKPTKGSWAFSCALWLTCCQPQATLRSGAVRKTHLAANVEQPPVHWTTSWPAVQRRWQKGATDGGTIRSSWKSPNGWNSSESKPTTSRPNRPKS